MNVSNAIDEPSRRTVLQVTGSVLATGSVAGCLGAASSEPSGTPAATNVEVAVAPVADGKTEFVFAPTTETPLGIDAGTTVRFVWKTDTHNVVLEKQPDDADWQGHEEVEDAGFVHEHTFEVAGTYRFVCEPHESLGMEGTILVE